MGRIRAALAGAHDKDVSCAVPESAAAVVLGTGFNNENSLSCPETASSWLLTESADMIKVSACLEGTIALFFRIAAEFPPPRALPRISDSCSQVKMPYVKSFGKNFLQLFQVASHERFVNGLL